MPIHDGGPAFPKTGNFNEDQTTTYDSEDQDGMSLRDYFAAKALVGIISHPTNQGTPAAVADISYQIADAMLLARSK